MICGMRPMAVTAAAALLAVVLCNRAAPQSVSAIDLQHAVYQELADRLLAAGKIDQAQRALQLLKERELADDIAPAQAVTKSMQAAAGSPAASLSMPSSDDRKRYARYYDLSSNQTQLGNERLDLEQKMQNGAATALEAARLKDITTRLFPQINAARDAFFAQLQEDVFNQRKPGQDVTDVRGTESRMRSAVVDLGRVDSASHAVGLQYVEAAGNLTIILVTAGAPPIARQVAIESGELARQVHTARELLRMPQSDPRRLQDALMALRLVLIQPVEADLAAVQAHTLMILPGDLLRAVPFAALSDGRRFLVQDYAITLFSDAVQATSAAPKNYAWNVAGMGSTRAAAGLPALPAVGEELNGILGQPGIQGARYLDDQFNHDRLTSSLGGDFNVLHIASHFVLRPGRPEASRLYLGDRSQLSLADVAMQDMRFDRFDLVTFSACETGVAAGVDAYGHELEGLAVRVQTQGAKAVMASLWKVYDSSTAQFMREFYRAHGTGHVNKAEALRSAQLNFIAGGKDAPQAALFKHPYYWAPFVLLGNWQ